MNTRRTKALVIAGVLAATGLAGPALAQAPDPNVTILDRPRPDFDPLGVRAGNFLILPELTVSEDWDDNVFAAENDEESDFFTRIQPTIEAQSNFVRHELGFLVSADIGRYSEFDSENFTDFFSELNGTLDVRRNIAIDASANGGRFSQNRDDPEDTGVGDRQNYWSYGGDLAYRQTFNRLNVRIGGSAQRDQYDDLDVGGVEVNQDDRNVNEYDGTLRVGYLVSPRINVFTEGRYFVSDRDEDDPVNRDYDGWEARVGAAVDLTAVLFGQAYVGYIDASFDNPDFDDANGPSYGADLTWNITTLTTLSLNGDRDFEPTQTNGASSRLTSTIFLNADHELLRNVLIGASGGFIQDDFEGIDRTDDRYEAGANITYLINRYFSVSGRYLFETRNSKGTDATNDYDRNLFSIGLTAQL